MAHRNAKVPQKAHRQSQQGHRLWPILRLQGSTEIVQRLLVGGQCLCDRRLENVQFIGDQPESIEVRDRHAVQGHPISQSWRESRPGRGVLDQSHSCIPQEAEKLNLALAGIGAHSATLAAPAGGDE